MTDGCGRDIHYLRLSVTDRCNLRCRYCMPHAGVSPLPQADILRFDEILRLARILAGLGVHRVRLTGGEPLVRRGLPRLAAGVRAVEGIRFLGLTTNGVRLKETAGALLRAGVDGLNVSLDTLDAGRYAALTGANALPAALDGLRAALALPFAAVKVNCVLAPGSIPEDWLGVVGLAQAWPVDVRLIEWMPMTGPASTPPPPADEALNAVARRYGPLRPTAGPRDGGPARLYRLPGFAGRVGVISAISHRFCADCNRLRLTAAGDLKLCLFYDVGLSLKPLLRGGASDGDIAGAVLAAVQEKPAHHRGRPLPGSAGGACSLIDHGAGMHHTGG